MSLRRTKGCFCIFQITRGGLLTRARGQWAITSNSALFSLEKDLNQTEGQEELKISQSTPVVFSQLDLHFLKAIQKYKCNMLIHTYICNRRERGRAQFLKAWRSPRTQHEMIRMIWDQEGRQDQTFILSQQVKWHPEGSPQLQGIGRRPRSGQWPKSWKSPPLPPNS